MHNLANYLKYYILDSSWKVCLVFTPSEDKNPEKKKKNVRQIAQRELDSNIFRVFKTTFIAYCKEK